MNYYDPLRYVVPPDADGWTLRTVMRSRMGISRKLMSRVKLTTEGITVNGERRYVNTPVRAGDLIEIRMERETSEDILPEPIAFDILYEDEYLLIVNKAAGLIVHPTHGHYTGTLANGVVHYWEQLGQSHRFRPIHRLDQDTSGVLAIAKNAYAHQQVAEQMLQGTVEKEYAALVAGHPPQLAGTIDAPIGRRSDDPKRRTVREDGYPAVTHYTTVEQMPNAALLRVRLETGRTHQIRVHLAFIGCPIWGDKLYGPEGEHEAVAVISRQALHAERLSFLHPATGERCEFEAPLPADMREWMRRLQAGAAANREESK